MRHQINADDAEARVCTALDLATKRAACVSSGGGGGATGSGGLGCGHACIGGLRLLTDEGLGGRRAGSDGPFLFLYVLGGRQRLLLGRRGGGVIGATAGTSAMDAGGALLRAALSNREI